MSTERKLIGAPETLVNKAKLTNGGLFVESEECFVFDDSTTETEGCAKTYKKEPHPDLIESFNDLKPFLVEIVGIDKSREADVTVTGFVGKELQGEKPMGLITGKLKTVDGKTIAINTPLLMLDVTAYKKGKAMNAALIAAEKEVLKYVLTGHCANPHEWTLFNQQAAPQAAGK